MSSDLPPLPNMVGDEVLLPQLHYFPTINAVSCLPRDDRVGGGGDGGIGWTWLDDVSDGCGIEVGGGGVDTALPQVRFNHLPPKT
jgi:hypothetical protein